MLFADCSSVEVGDSPLSGVLDQNRPFCTYQPPNDRWTQSQGEAQYIQNPVLRISLRGAAMPNTLSLGHGSNGAFDDGNLQQLVLDDLKDLLAEQEEFYGSLSLKEKINQQDLQMASNRTDKDTLHAAVVEFYNAVHHQARAKEQSDRHGMGKLSGRLSTFAKWTLDFFETYSGISEIVRGIDNNFGPIAYGTFSIFLMVAQSKEVHRVLIQSILEELGNWLPRLETIRAKERSHPRLMKFVLDIYIETVRFFRYATEFLCSARASRAWKLISRPPQQDLQKRLDMIKEKSKGLLEELTLRLYEQQDEMARQLTRIENFANENAEFAKRNAGDDHRNQLQRVAKALDLPPDFDANVALMITHCDSQVYQALFEFQRKAAFRPVRLRQISLQALSQRLSYKAWMSATQSSLLLLGGENRDISIPQSWLSPVATKFFHFVQQSPKCKVVFHSINAARVCHRYQSPEHEILLALKSILYQVLSKETRLCLSFYEKFFQAGSLPSTDSISEDQIEKRIHDCVKILSEVLSSSYLEAQTVFIVLDGVERLSAPAPQTLFESVLQLLDECDEQATIKVLAICSALGLGNIKDSKDEKGLRFALGQGGNRQIMERVFADLCWNQPVLQSSN